MLCCCCSIMAFGQNMTQDIEKISKGKQASVGVAIIHNDDIIAIANEDKYPTMSVFKFHIAVPALKKMEAENIPPVSYTHLDPRACEGPVSVFVVHGVGIFRCQEPHHRQPANFL